MYNQEMLKQLTFSTDTVLKFLVYYHHFVLFYNFLVRHNRMLNPCHELLYYINNIQGFSIKENVYLSDSY